MIGLIGIILLMGIVKKNAIMMIDFALEAERHQGMSPYDAIVQACLLRFRPIMMTTLAALFGALPLAIESGTGAELRFPLGISIIGGLLLSQLLTLYTTPVIYLALDRLNRKIEKAGPPDPGPPGPPVAGATEGCSRWHRSRSPSSAGRSGTTLLAIGLFLVGIVAYRIPAGVGGSQRRFSDDPGLRHAAGRGSLGDGGNRGRAAGAAARRRSPGSTRSPRPVRWARPASSFSSRSAATSTARRATCRPRSTPRWRILPTRPAVAAAFPQGQSIRRPVFVLALTSKTLTTSADVRRRRYRDRPAHLAGAGRRRGDRQRRGPAARCGSRSIRCCWSNAGIATDDVRARHRQRQSRWGRSASFNGDRPERDAVASIKQMRTAAEFQRHHRSRLRAAISSACPMSPTSRIRPQQPLGRLVQQAAGGSAPDHQAGRRQRASTPSTGSRRCCPS